MLGVWGGARLSLVLSLMMGVGGIWLGGHQADWQMKANATPPRNLFHTPVSLMLGKLHFEEMETTEPLGSIRSISLQSRQINWG